MDTNEAAATGALPGDVRQDDLKSESEHSPKHRGSATEAAMQVPAGATDPMWYLIADHLAPHNIGSTFRRGYVEGFVAGCEAVRGIDAEVGLSDVLRSSVGMEVEVPVAVRQPSPHKADVESLAKFMFERQCTFDETTPEEVEAAWSDPGVAEFWRSEAEAVLRFLP